MPGEYGLLSTVLCLNCSFKFLNPRYDDLFYKIYYKKNYRKIAFGSFNPSKDYIKRQVLRGSGVNKFFSKFLPKKGSVLDHGCASGATMIAWKKKGWETKGIDPHGPSVTYGKKKLKLDIKRAFGEKLPFKKNSFDVVLSLGSLEHSYDLNKSLSEIFKVLKNNGKLIIRWRSNKIICSPLEYYNHNHNRFFNEFTWKIALKKFGFSDVRFIKDKPEGYISYEYIIAKKSKKNTYKINFKNKYQVNNELKYHKFVEKKYMKWVKIFKRLKYSNITMRQRKNLFKSIRLNFWV